MDRLDLCLPALRRSYLNGSLTPAALLTQLHAAMDREDAACQRNVWIHRLSLAALLAHAETLQDRDPASLPLYGVPFAIKDNIDLAGVPTTAACPDFAYLPAQSATAVQRLMDAGAIPLGKTNLDQFATGLVGTRSPYGACRNALDAAYISGGSSSGSAVAVALGLASFSLGTDTAGSGRVPAMFNNVVGLKPSCGRIPATGVVPACRTLDTVSVFALTAGDAAAVLAVAQGEDAADPYARSLPPHGFAFEPGAPFRFGVPRAEDLEFFGDPDAPLRFADAVAALTALRGTAVTIDLRPFRDVARLLYEGPWVAERAAALGAFLTTHAASLHPVTRAIIERGTQVGAVETFQALYRLRALQRQAATVWGDAREATSPAGAVAVSAPASPSAWATAPERAPAIDCLVVPTAPTIYTVAQVEADPLTLNSNLSHYTNFVNLLDLAAVAVPTGWLRTSSSDAAGAAGIAGITERALGVPPADSAAAGLPFGVTLIAPAGQDFPLLNLAARLHTQGPAFVGATGHQPHRDPEAVPDARAFPSGMVKVAVCGAHLSGLPLNHQLTQRGARLVRATSSAARYKLYALPDGPPFRPGMVPVAEGGAAIALELWAMPAQAFGSFVAAIPAPLGIGPVELDDGTVVQGFVCDPTAVADARDISAYGGWRAWRAAQPVG